MAFDIAGAATNAVETVKNVFTSDGPAASLSSIATSIEEGFKKFTSSLGSLFAPANATPFLLPLPLPNVLNNYATYNYVFSLGCLSDQMVNFPDSTYKAGIEPQLILKSANGSPDNRVATAYGKFDFFIDSCTINSLIGNDKATGNTNATNIAFTVVEPYSMGLFMMSCQQAAFDAGWKNFREAAFLLKIEFKGNTQTGIAQTIPNTTKYIPFRFTNISMKVTGKGSVYQVDGLPYNEQAFSKQVATLRTDTTITGKTVQEVLQTGPNSLQAVINGKFKELEKQKIVEQADQVLIYFPKDIASGSSAASSQTTQENDTGATASTSASSEDVYKKLGVTISDKNATLVQDTGQCNAIGQAPMGFDISRKADTPMANGQKVYNEKTGIEIRGKLVADPEVSNFKFSQDTNIPNAINQVILASKFPEGSLDPANITPEGYRGWWKIETQVFVLGGKENSGTGTKPKLFVYRVIPYAVHASRMMPPGAPAPGFQQLKQQVVKEYNYIYTGKNQEIINFNIDIANGFQQMMLADNGNNTADEKTAKDDGAGIEKGSEMEAKKGNVFSGTPGGGMTSQASYSKIRTGTDSKGGGGAETNSTRIARLFHDALTNGKDLVNLDLEIVGDPYFLATSGFGNYTAAQTTKSNINSDMEVNYQNGEVDIVVNFRTPIDINQSTGLYNFGGTAGVNQFSGLYKVTTLVSTFSKGKFTQKLSGFRRQGQDDFRKASIASLPTATPTAPEPESEYAEVVPSNPQVFDDGSSIQTFDDGSTLVTDSDGNVSSTPAKE